MSIALASQPLRYRAWDPTAKQFHEPDTLYLMDLDIEAQIPSEDGGMYGAGEGQSFGAVEHRPPWFGGSQVEVVEGRYRDGLHPLTAATFAWLILPIGGILPTEEFTAELFVKSSAAWASVAETSIILQMQSDTGQRIAISTFQSTVTVSYTHNNSPVAALSKSFTHGHAAAADAWVSLALTLLSGTLRLYVNGTLANSVTGCTAPLLHSDDVTRQGGLSVATSFSNAPGSVNLTVSDLRISRLARVPGQVPG